MNPAVPCLPDNAPFSPEQRAYLNGFLAGLLSRTPIAPEAGTAAANSSAPANRPARALAFVYATQTGTAESLARKGRKRAAAEGRQATADDLAKLTPATLPRDQDLLFIASTFGEGDPPDSARTFWNALTAPEAPRLDGVRYAVCALGDSSYPKYCAFGRALDERLAALGAQRITARAECDGDPGKVFEAWLGQTLEALSPSASDPLSCPPPRASLLGNGGRNHTDSEEAAPEQAESTTERPSRQRPFPARLLASRTLNQAGSAKETRHFEISTGDGVLQYEAGDALGVWPRNCPELVRELISAMGWEGNMLVPDDSGMMIGLEELLAARREITRIPTPLLAAYAERTGDPRLRELSAPEANGTLTQFLAGRDLLDLAREWPGVTFEPAEFVNLLRPLQPRLYSISSSPRRHPHSIHLTTAVVRFDSLGRRRKGVCSAFLADRVRVGWTVPVYVHSNPAFRPPADSNTPLIMVGPGTGIAPFRAFLQQREAQGAQGRNWLFFGDQHQATDFLYREEIERWHAGGLLTRLSTAFSRDQADKVYVQTRMLEAAKELFDWLEDGAAFYVCGDAARMARDVDAALRTLIERAGGRTREQADAYVEALRTAGRYRRDVY